MAKKWTEAECKFLEAHFEKMDNKKLAEKFEVSPKAVSSKLRALGFKREEAKVDKKVSPAKKELSDGTKTHKKAKTQVVTKSLLHQNVRCRHCFTVDGYTQKEQKCRYCGKNLFKDDVL